LEWEVDSTRWLAIGDSAQISITACAQDGTCSTATRWAVLLNDQKPVLGFSGMPLEAPGRQFGAPFGPGLGVSGAEIETGFSTPAYFSFGAARSAGLVYSTRQSYPRVLVPVDLELTWPAGNPDQIKLTLFDGGLKLDSLVLTTPTCATGATRRCRAVLQGDFATQGTFNIPTRKWLTIEAQVTSGSTTQIGTDSVEIVVVDRRITPYGSGWWPAGVPKLVAAGSDRLLVGSSGAVAVYRGFGDSLYLAPIGDFSALVKTGSGWELRVRGSTAKLVFDTNGRLIKSVDQNGNRDSIAYSGTSDQVTSFVDPAGKTISLAYDGNGKLSTITDPGSRQTKVTINSSTNQLTYDSLSSPTTRAYRTTYVYQTYPGTNTVALTKRIGVITDTTIVTYDSTFKRRPVQARLPQVRDESGSVVNPLITYTAYERKGYGGLASLDSVYVELKDPRNYWTRSLLNRWGEARKTWDSLGVLDRAEYTPEGFVLWSEGKVADSSRVYSSYDGLRRLARTYLVRGVGDTLRLDSLVYDANHRVVQRIDARGKVSRLVYDGNGNLTLTITPNSDSTVFGYLSTGLVDSTRAPTFTKARHFFWDATWKNAAYTVNETGMTVDRHLYDGLGRDTLNYQRVRTRTAGTQTYYQWRGVRRYYNAANQLDSVVSRRTDECLGCSTPVWVLDSLHTQRVSYVFDRAGRDSLRLSDRSKATLYLYDRLGRLLSRRPWTDSMAVKDSFVYDVAGNLKKTITRRGDAVTTNWDSRNRDTLTVIPGVGTLRKVFTGPEDELTRLWYDSPTDPIGGVNGELRWGYDQHGRLKADTSYAGSRVRRTTYTYDVFERRSTASDSLGTWTTRYETNRGVGDTLLTPLGDTISYAFDHAGRALGPYLHGAGGPLLSRVPYWSGTGGLDSLVQTVATTPTSYTPLAYAPAVDSTDKIDPPQAVTWRQQEGSGASSTALQDSVIYDAWQRARMTLLIDPSGGVRDSFDFDRTQNIRTPTGSESYDLVTNRLMSRVTSGHTWRYQYDRAGNVIQAVDSTSGSLVTWAYTFDAVNRLTAVQRNGTLIARYGYDLMGRRIVKRVYSTASGGTVAYTRFVYHGDAVAFESDSVGNNIGLRYTWGLDTDELLAIRDASGNHFYVVTDLLGSIRGLVKRDGTWVLSQRFGPYATVIARDTNATGPGFALRYLWTGREYDAETGWYFHRSRYFDPQAHRFVQEDPIGFGGGPNPYTYANGDAMQSTDPSGLLQRWAPGQHDQVICWSDACLGIGSEEGPGGGIGGISTWEFIPDGHGGGEYMPPGLNPELQGVFSRGVVAIGEIVYRNAKARAAAGDNRTSSGEIAETGGTSVGDVESPEPHFLGQISRFGVPWEKGKNLPGFDLTVPMTKNDPQLNTWGTWSFEFKDMQRRIYSLGPDDRSINLRGQWAAHYIGMFYPLGEEPGGMRAEGWVFVNGWGLFIGHPGGCGCLWNP
jgi:RHS repeat-associated protein